MIVLYYGTEPFQTAQAVRAARERAKRDGHDITVYDCERQYVCDDIVHALGARSLFASQRTVVILHFFARAAAADHKRLIVALERLTDDTVIFADNIVPRKNAALFTWLTEHADSVTRHDPLAGVALGAWARERAKFHGMAHDAAALGALCAAVGDDLYRMEHEIAKLAAFAHGRVCTVEDVQQLVTGDVSGNMFATVEALCAADRSRAMCLLYTQRAAGDDGFHIFAMYAYQVRLLIRVASAVEQEHVRDKKTLAARLKIHPFVAQKSLAIVRTVSLARLKALHHLLTLCDRDVKTGRRDINGALDHIAMFAR